MKHPSTWTKSDLHHHLQHALDLELWTIPLYLTALYSIKDLTKSKHSEYPEAAKLIFSVVIQEMLHIELVCNLSNALGFSPKFSPPKYDEKKGIPFIHPAKEILPPSLHGYHVSPQALNESSLRLFCAIELPHHKSETPWDQEKSYTCISDLYEAIKLGITTLWNQCYVGEEHNTKQKNNFKEYHNTHGKHHGFSERVNSPESAMKAIDAIVEQGEGADSKKVPADFRPPHPKEGNEYDVSWHKGHLSHYQKFRILLHSHHKLPPTYEITGNNGSSTSPPAVFSLPNSDASALDSEHVQTSLNTNPQEHLKESFLNFLSVMQDGFHSPGEEMPHAFWNKMFALGHALAHVWEAGMCPDFDFES